MLKKNSTKNKMKQNKKKETKKGKNKEKTRKIKKSKNEEDSNESINRENSTIKEEENALNNEDTNWILVLEEQMNKYSVEMSSIENPNTDSENDPKNLIKEEEKKSFRYTNQYKFQ